MDTIEKIPDGRYMDHAEPNVDSDAALKAVMEELWGQNQRLQQFAHIVSHNLRSHSGNLELMLRMFRESNDTVERELYLDQIEKISVSLTETIFNLSEVIRIQKAHGHEKQEIKITEVVQKAVNTLKAELEKAGARVITEYGWDELHCEPAYIDSIVLNLLCNAVKYRDPARKAEIHVKTERVNEKKVLKINDNGLGIDMELYGDKLFGMYKTFHKNKDARGIGLFITKSQVEAMGGRIWAESIPGVGSQFTVEFMI